jgi:hypothetical protein
MAWAVGRTGRERIHVLVRKGDFSLKGGGV